MSCVMHKVLFTIHFIARRRGITLKPRRFPELTTSAARSDTPTSRTTVPWATMARKRKLSEDATGTGQTKSAASTKATLRKVSHCCVQDNGFQNTDASSSDIRLLMLSIPTTSASLVPLRHRSRSPHAMPSSALPSWSKTSSRSFQLRTSSAL